MPALALLGLLPGAAGAAERPPFDEGKLSFSVRFRDETVPYRVFFTTAMPGEPLRVSVLGRGTDYDVAAPAGRLRRLEPLAWEWRAPDTARLVPLTLTRASTGETMTLNVFVLVPLGRVRNGALNGYRIGAYPTVALRGLDIYRPPRGLMEVTPENQDTWVSPHFQLRQFLCKQAGGWPKYVVLRERLLRKLEYLLAEVNWAGHRADTFFVMSGYRTPYYNAAIKNVKYSRHQWGGAADIFIDESPRDGVMDDLNGDGRIDVEDAGVLYDLVDRQQGKKEFEPFIGGLGRYRTTASHGPFIHVDARGFRARWGH